MRNLLFWVLLPFLLPQALYVRQNAPRFAPAAGPTNGRFGTGEPLRLLAIGDSIIAGVGATTLTRALVGRTAAELASKLSNSVHWQALGVSGYTAKRVLSKLMPMLPEQPSDFIILSVGVNDVTGLTTIRRWRENLQAVLDQLEANSPNAVIAVSGLPPLHGFPLLPQPLRAVFGMRSRALDKELRALVDQRPNCLYVALDFDPDPSQFSPDGYHPSEKSYAEYGSKVADALVARGAISVSKRN